MIMKSISVFAPRPVQLEINEGPKIVQISNTLSLREIVTRSLRGYPIPDEMYHENNSSIGDVDIDDVRQPIYDVDEMYIKDYYINRLQREKATAMREVKSANSVAVQSSEPPIIAVAGENNPD